MFVVWTWFSGRPFIGQIVGLIRPLCMMIICIAVEAGVESDNYFLIILNEFDNSIRVVLAITDWLCAWCYHTSDVHFSHYLSLGIELDRCIASQEISKFWPGTTIIHCGWFLPRLKNCILLYIVIVNAALYHFVSLVTMDATIMWKWLYDVSSMVYDQWLALIYCQRLVAYLLVPDKVTVLATWTSLLWLLTALTEAQRLCLVQCSTCHS